MAPMVDSTESTDAGSALSPFQQLRVVLLLVGGSAFAAAVLVVVPIVTLHMALAGDVHGVGDVGMEAVFFALCLVLVVIVLRAARRARASRQRGGLLPWVARLLPIPLALGVIGGIVFAVQVDADHDAIVVDLGKATCRDALGAQATDAELDRCAPDGIACNRAEEERERTQHLGPSAHLGADGPEAICVRERRHLPPPPPPPY